VYSSSDMVTHMKTTIEISDALLAEAKREAQRRGTTLRALVEGGLRRVLEDRQRRSDFRLRDVSVDGRGIRPEFASAGWPAIRAAAYDERGG
jgi:Arc/MetJ family transcription regulator